jgi:hypothetical protein
MTFFLMMYSIEGNHYLVDEENPLITVVEESFLMKAGEKHMVGFCMLYFLFQILFVRWQSFSFKDC